MLTPVAPLLVFESNAFFPQPAIPPQIQTKSEFTLFLTDHFRAVKSDVLSLGAKILAPLSKAHQKPLYQLHVPDTLFIPTDALNVPDLTISLGASHFPPSQALDPSLVLTSDWDLEADLGTLALTPTPSSVLSTLALVQLGALSGPALYVDLIERSAPHTLISVVSEVFVRDREFLLHLAYLEENVPSTYDSLPQFARLSLDRHAHDTRAITYSHSDLAAGTNVHDKLWCTIHASLQSLGTIVHPVLRGYWVSQIILWTPSPRDAFAIALDLYSSASILPPGDPRLPLLVAAPGFGFNVQPSPTEKPIFGRIPVYDVDTVKASLSISKISTYLL